MRRTLWAALLIGTIAGSPAWAATITLKPGQSVQAAVNAAKPGTTILLAPGTYTGSVDLSGRDGITLKSAGAPGSARIVGSKNQAALQANRLSNIAIEGLTIHADAGGTDEDVGGIKFWGSYERFQNVRIIGNTVTGEGQDGIKLFNMPDDRNGNVIVAGNRIEGNWRQEAIDNVSIKGVKFEGNQIGGRAAYSGITCKAGCQDVEIINNTITTQADKSAIVGGRGNSRLERMDQFPAGFHGPEAQRVRFEGNRTTGDVDLVSAKGNQIVNNSIGGRVGFGANGHMPNSISEEETRRSNTVGNNSVSVAGAAAWDGNTAGPSGGFQPVAWGAGQLDAQKIENDMATMRANGLNASAIKYAFGLEGIELPDDVINGRKSVQQAIDDNTLKQTGTPVWSIPRMPESPQPDTTPRGSSASSWSPSIQTPSVEQMRQSINSRPRPPNC